MKPNDVSVALSNLHGGFNSFTKQVSFRSKAIECLKEKIDIEVKLVKLIQMQELHLQRKVSVLQGLSSLLGSETSKVKELQQKIIEQHKSLLKMSEIMRELGQAHLEAVNGRKQIIEKFNRSYKQRLSLASKKRWEAEQDRVEGLNATKSKLEEQLRSLKMAVEKRERECKKEENDFEVDMFKKERKLAQEAKYEIAQLQKKKSRLFKTYNDRLNGIKVQSEGKIRKLKEEYEALQQNLKNFPRSYTGTGGETAPSKGTKRKMGNTYLDYCKGGNESES